MIKIFKSSIDTKHYNEHTLIQQIVEHERRSLMT